MSLSATQPPSIKKRGRLYLVILFLAAAVGSVFQINFMVFFHQNWFAMRRVPIDVAGMFSTEHHASAALRGVSVSERIHFLQPRSRDVHDYLTPILFDGKSFSPTEDRRARVDATIELPRHPVPQLIPRGESLWVTEGHHALRQLGGAERVELIDPSHHHGWSRPERRVVSQGRPEYFQAGPQGIRRVSLVNGGQWQTTASATLPLPLLTPAWKVADTVVRTSADQRAALNRDQFLRVVCDDSGVHLFVLFDTALLYRADIPFQKTANANGSLESLFSDAVSALLPENVPFRAEGWTVLTANLPIPVTVPPTPTASNGMTARKWYPLMIEGEPAVIVIDDSDPARPQGLAFRQQGKQWEQLTSCPFPFGTEQYSLVTENGARHAHFLTATSLGGWSCYRIDATGFHRERASGPFEELEPSFDRELRFLYEVLRNSLIATLILGKVVSLLMRFATRADYAFGHSRVTLASLWRRGMARGIDLGLTGLSLVPLLLLSRAWVDWSAWLEARNLRLHHSSISQVWVLILAGAVWLLVMVSLLSAVQGRWGWTPGKWLCGLRVVGTTLKPCGFARSAAREVMLFADSLYLCCWSSGVVCIALTNHRQRLGDLVADTLVIEVR